MRKTKKSHNILFFVVLFLSMLAATPFIWAKIYDNKFKAPTLAKETLQEESSESSAPETSAEETTEPSTEETTAEETTQPSTEETSAEETSAEETTAAPFRTVDDSYFADALFIGDSRTRGIMEYGGITTATYFCDTGLSLASVLQKEYDVPGIGKTTLQNLLSSKSYGKIYLMFGVNELGYPYDGFTKKYVEVLDTVRKAQPNAIIYLQANLHLTAKKSSSNDVYTNEKLNAFNTFIQSLADPSKKLYFIDVNEIFDDENHNLRAEYSNDGAHVYGKYYIDWANWLKTKAL